MLEKSVSICTETSAKVYNSRGTYAKGIASPQLGYVWEQRKSSTGKYSFYINKKHPLLNDINKLLDATGRENLKSYLSLIENYAPFMQSGVVEQMMGKSDQISLDTLEAKKDLQEIKGYVRCFFNKGYKKEEIEPIIVGMANYRYLKDEIMKMFKEERYD
jgi:hypothetical protein